MRTYEFSTLDKFDSIVAVSDNDKKEIIKQITRTPVEVIGTGVNLDFFTKRKDEERRPGNIVFSGSMDWIPNEDCMLYFVNEIYPLIKQEIPHASLTIVGRKPTPLVRNLASGQDKIEVTGTVDDIRPYLSGADCFVVPLRIAGGTRLKIPEAMSVGLAVVSTSIGAEGLGLEGGENILIADTQQDFAEKVIQVIKKRELRDSIGNNARDTVEKRFSWENIGGQFERIIQQTLQTEGQT